MGLLRNAKIYFQALGHFNHKLVISMSLIYFLLFGVFERMIDTVQFTYFDQDLGLSVKQNNYFLATIDSPYAAQAVIVMFSEVYPLFGYNKRYYMVVSGVVGIASSVWILFNYHKGILIYLIPVCVVFTINVGVVFTVMMHAKSTSIIRKQPVYGSYLLTWVSILTSTGSILGNFVGIWVEHFRPVYIYGWAIPMMLLPTIMVALGYFPEKKRPIKLNVKRLHEKKESYILAAVICVLSVTMTFVKVINDSYYVDLAYGLFIIMIFALAYYFLKDKILLLRIYFFAFIYDFAYIRYYSARNTFYTENLSSCLKHTPQFDSVFFYTYSKFTEKISALIGPFIFQIFLVNIDIRFTIFFQAMLRIVLLGTDQVIVQGLAHKWGMNEKAIYILHAVMDGVTHTMRHLSYSAMCNYVNTKHPNNMILPLFYSFNSLGYTASKNLGGTLTKYFAIRKAEKLLSCDFSGYRNLSLIAAVTCPVVTLLVFWFVVPGFRASDFKETGRKKGGDGTEVDSEKKGDVLGDSSEGKSKDLEDRHALNDGFEKADLRMRV